MKARTWLLLVAVFVWGCVVWAPCQPPRADAGTTSASAVAKPQADQAANKTKQIKDVVYANPGDKPQTLDLYFAEKNESQAPLPLVVWIHGGGWWGGNKNGCPAVFLAQRGYVVASINYRLSQDAIFPAQIEDCKAAIRYLRANAAKYQIDPNRIGVWGGSAGGHLVALLGTSGDVKELEGKEGDLTVSSRVQAVCDWFGPTDMTGMTTLTLKAPDGKQVSPVERLLGGTPEEKKEKAAQVNPITWVTKDDPPFLIMHGTKDPLVPLKQSEMLQEALKKAGVDSTLEIIPGAGHGFAGPKYQQMVMDFFDRTLKKQK
ncbi:MAG: alpha/beta hydrolase [Candidatus Sumerlaeota bacterium]|nr:alpha/beta hydrolase [Candidatus Sumerlaeota bacterium]